MESRDKHYVVHSRKTGLYVKKEIHPISGTRFSFGTYEEAHLFNWIMFSYDTQYWERMFDGPEEFEIRPVVKR